MEQIRLRNVDFNYGRTPVLIDIDLGVEKGDFLALIGPNGSGKTTLVKIMVGLLAPKSGRVELFGRPRSEFRDWDMLGYVPQNSANIDPLFPASVEEVLGMSFGANRRLLKKKGLKMGPAIEEALKAVGMEEQRRTPINSLSGGQQQRVFIARSLVTEPAILILDEPTTGVDALTQTAFYEMLNRLNKERSITIVLVTHEIGVVNRHVNKVACLNQRLIYHGSHEEFCTSEAFRDILERGDHIVSHIH